ncbi:magnesium transporter [Nitratiruptor sp. SB155-2]|uniref:magnesium transporter n=1 Tax=Nitratiruptor sp. (strain SB155-2) TaxID=387092 RepID=UPI00059BAB4F|nr:magnesium transporter [Nitratiruptor sp. SB155-2]
MEKAELIKIGQILQTELKSKDITLHPSEIAAYLKYLATENPDEFNTILRQLPEEVLGEVLLELPESIKDIAIERLSVKKLAKAVEELDSDDAVDLVKDIEDIDETLEQKVLDNIDKEYKEEIEELSAYDEETAGAYMQTEVYKAYEDEKIADAIERLRKLKDEGELSNIHQVYVVDKEGVLKAIIPLEDLILYDFNERFSDIMHEKRYEPITVRVDEPVADLIKKFEDYNLAVLAVVDEKGRLLGRITSDDVIDLIEEQATEQIYNLAGVEDEVEEEGDIKEVTKKRAWWLFINLGTAILASFVIGLFDETIQKYVALAVLMPIVASMGGNAGTQTLTVVVRKLALGEIDWQNAKKALLQETLVSLINGAIFALVMGIIAWVWFHDHLLGVVIALAMVINLLAAGFFGAVIPLFLKKIGQDPAVGSSVLLTTVTDVVGFFAFLGLAKVMLVH